MKIPVLFLVSALMFGFSSPAISTEPSLNDLIAIGLRHNLGLQIKHMDIDSAESAVAVEEAAFDAEFFSLLGYQHRKTPFVLESVSNRTTTRELSGSLGVRKRFTTGLAASLTTRTERSSGFDAGSSLDPRYRSLMVAELNQPLLRDFGGDVNRTALVRSGYRLDQTELEYLLEAQYLALQLESAVRMSALQSLIVGLREESLDLAEQLIRFNRIRFEQGLVPVTEIQGSEAVHAARKLQRAQARQEYDQTLIQLDRQFNGGLPASFDPQRLVAVQLQSFDQPPAFEDWEEEATAALQQRLDYKIARLSLQSVKVLQHYYHNQIKPQLDLRLQAGVNGLAGRQSVATPYAGGWGDSIDGMSSADGYQWGAALEFSLPLGNRAAQSRYRNSRIMVGRQNVQLADLQQQVRSEVREQLVRCRHALEQIDVAAEVERLATVALNQEQRRLEEGLSDTFRMVSFQDRMIAARIDHLTAITGYHLALAELDFIRGRGFERYNIHLTGYREGF